MDLLLYAGVQLAAAGKVHHAVGHGIQPREHAPRAVGRAGERVVHYMGGDAGALGENLALTADRINFRWVRGKNKFFALDNSIRLNANIITIGTERINYSAGASFVIEDMATSEEAISYLVLMNDVVLHSDGNDEADTIIKAGTYAFAGSINLLTESDRLIFISNETNAYNNKGKMRLVKTEDSEIIYGN